MSALGEDISSALAMFNAAAMTTSQIARTLSRSEAWVELQIELAKEQAAREADAEARAKVRAAARAETFRQAQERGRATRAARIKAEALRDSSIDASDYSAGVVERTFRTSIGFGAAIRIGDAETGRLLFVETLGDRLDVGRRVKPMRSPWTWYVAP